VKVTKDKVENGQAYLTIEMEPAEVEEGLNKAYHRLVRKTSIPGFRKGKAPRAILEQFVGAAALMEDAVNHMAPEATDKAIQEQQLKIISRPEVELEKVEPIIYKAVIPLEPVIKLGEYKGVRVPAESVELKEEDTDKTLEALRHQHALWEPVERLVAYDDLAILDIESNVGTQPFINQKDAQYQVARDSEFPMKGFAEQVIGLKIGESKEFSLTFPSDLPREELAGKDVKFKVTVKEIKIEKLPEVNDEFAKLVNPEIKTIDELKERIRENIKHQAEDKAKTDYEKKVVEEVVKGSEAEFPPILVEEEIDRMIRDQMRRYQMDSKGMDEYLKSIKKTPEQLREELRPIATKSVKQSLVLSKIAEEEKVEIKEEDIKNEIDVMTQAFPDDKKAQMQSLLTSQEGVMSVASVIGTRKVLQKLTEIAKSPAPEKTEAQNTGETSKEA
jgi:trigger factor